MREKGEECWEGDEEEEEEAGGEEGFFKKCLTLTVARFLKAEG